VAAPVTDDTDEVTDEDDRRLAIELELAADQAELVLRRDTHLAALRHLSREAAALDAATARRCRDLLVGAAAGLEAAGDPAAAAVVEALARLIVAAQFSEYGSGRLVEMRLTLSDA
jgi:hypothetical protein